MMFYVGWFRRTATSKPAERQGREDAVPDVCSDAALDLHKIPPFFRILGQQRFSLILSGLALWRREEELRAATYVHHSSLTRCILLVCQRNDRLLHLRCWEFVDRLLHLHCVVGSFCIHGSQLNGIQN